MGRLGCMVVEWSHGHRAFSPLPHCPLRRRNSLAMWRGMDMGEALMAVIDPLEDHTMSDPRLASRFAVPRWTLQDTPLETPCLCLELRERIKKEWWKARHLRGEVLVPDPSPRQSQMQKSERENFYLLAGMVVPDEEKRAPYFKKIKSLVGVMAGLGMWKPTSAEQRRRRSSCIASLAAGLAVVVSKLCRVGGGKNGQKWSREDEPGQPPTLRAQHEMSGGGRSQEGARGDEPGQFPDPTRALSLNGSRSVGRDRVGSHGIEGATNWLQCAWQPGDCGIWRSFIAHHVPSSTSINTFPFGGSGARENNGCVCLHG